MSVCFVSAHQSGRTETPPSTNQLRPASTDKFLSSDVAFPVTQQDPIKTINVRARAETKTGKATGKKNLRDTFEMDADSDN